MPRRTLILLFVGRALLAPRGAAAESAFLQKTIDYEGAPVKYVVYTHAHADHIGSDGSQGRSPSRPHSITQIPCRPLA